MSVSFPTICFCFTNLSLLVLEIFRFCHYHALNLNTPQKNSASCDLQLGFNSAFKGLMVVSAGEEENNECVCVRVGNSVFIIFNKYQLDIYCCVIDCNYPTL